MFTISCLLYWYFLLEIFIFKWNAQTLLSNPTIIWGNVIYDCKQVGDVVYDCKQVCDVIYDCKQVCDVIYDCKQVFDVIYDCK